MAIIPIVWQWHQYLRQWQATCFTRHTHTQQFTQYIIISACICILAREWELEHWVDVFVTTARLLYVYVWWFIITLQLICITSIAYLTLCAIMLGLCSVGWRLSSKTSPLLRWRNTYEEKEKKITLPTPGIEPGPPGWKPGILTTRPNGNLTTMLSYSSIRFWYWVMDNYRECVYYLEYKNLITTEEEKEYCTSSSYISQIGKLHDHYYDRIYAIWRLMHVRACMHYTGCTLSTQYFEYQYMIPSLLPYSVFCPHWSGVVGPTTTQPAFTTTQGRFTTLAERKSAEMLHFWLNLTTTLLILGRTMPTIYFSLYTYILSHNMETIL